MSNKQPETKRKGFFARLGHSLKNGPTLLKIMFYMTPLFFVVYLSSVLLYKLPGSFGGLILWGVAFYVFVGFNVSLRQVDRSRIIDEPFSLNLMLALSFGAIIWPKLKSK